MARSRLNNRLEKETKQRIAYAIIGAVLLLVLLLKFGIPLFSRFALFISDKTSSQSSSQTDTSKDSYIAPPTLNATFTATNSATIKVSGQAEKNQQVKLFVNTNAQDTVMTKSDGTFVFDTVHLDDGQNTIQVKAKVDDKYSNFSNSLTILYSKKGPDLNIENPTDGSTVKESNQMMRGQTSSDASVLINDHVAIVQSDGSFSYAISLKNGDNMFKVLAKDTAGNITEKDIKVNLTP